MSRINTYINIHINVTVTNDTQKLALSFTESKLQI